MVKDDKKRILKFFRGLKFVEDTHTYSVKGKNLSTSVSGKVELFVPHVDWYEISLILDKRKKLPLGTHNTLWTHKADAACSMGTKVHFFGEIYAFHRNIKPRCERERAIVKFFRELPKHIIVVFAELQMYHKKKMFGGTCDLLLYNTKTKKFIIADWKTNEDLEKNYKKQMLTPFEDLLDCPFNHYQIQFSLYQIMLEQVPGIEVERRILIYLEEDEYTMYDAEDYTERLRKHLHL